MLRLGLVRYLASGSIDSFWQRRWPSRIRRFGSIDTGLVEAAHVRVKPGGQTDERKGKYGAAGFSEA